MVDVTPCARLQHTLKGEAGAAPEGELAADRAAQHPPPAWCPHYGVDRRLRLQNTSGQHVHIGVRCTSAELRISQVHRSSCRDTSGPHIHGAGMALCREPYSSCTHIVPESHCLRLRTLFNRACTKRVLKLEAGWCTYPIGGSTYTSNGDLISHRCILPSDCQETANISALVRFFLRCDDIFESCLEAAGWGGRHDACVVCVALVYARLQHPDEGP